MNKTTSRLIQQYKNIAEHTKEAVISDRLISNLARLEGEFGSKMSVAVTCMNLGYADSRDKQDKSAIGILDFYGSQSNYMETLAQFSGIQSFGCAGTQVVKDIPYTFDDCDDVRASQLLALILANNLKMRSQRKAPDMFFIYDYDTIYGCDILNLPQSQIKKQIERVADKMYKYSTSYLIDKHILYENIHINEYNTLYNQTIIKLIGERFYRSKGCW